MLAFVFVFLICFFFIVLTLVAVTPEGRYFVSEMVWSNRDTFLWFSTFCPTVEIQNFISALVRIFFTSRPLFCSGEVVPESSLPTVREQMVTWEQQ